MDSDQDAILVLRAIGSIKQKPIYLREYRTHLMAEAVSYELDNEQVRFSCFGSCVLNVIFSIFTFIVIT